QGNHGLLFGCGPNDQGVAAAFYENPLLAPWFKSALRQGCVEWQTSPETWLALFGDARHAGTSAASFLSFLGHFSFPRLGISREIFAGLLRVNAQEIGD